MYLNCHSCFSLTYGVMQVEEVLQNAKKHGITSLALTDINNTSGCLEFLRLAAKYEIKPVVGVDFRSENNEQLYIAIAKNNDGFKEICDLLTEHTKDKKHIPATAPAFKNCFIVYPWKQGEHKHLREHESIGLRHDDISSFRFYSKYDSEKIVALAPVSFRNKHDFNTHRLLRAIGCNTLLSKLEANQQGRIEDICVSADVLIGEFAEYPRAIENANYILQQSNVYFEFGKTKNKSCFTGDKEKDRQLLTQLAEEGLTKRYKNVTPTISIRFYSELETICELNFTAYFLINWDIVCFARKQGFFHIGRGSGANSIIAYCLGITDVDPIELDLYFERFINSSRKNPPDFDIDFSHTDRDTVRNYIFNQYPEHVALVGSYSTFERDSAIREVAKVFGLPDEDIAMLQSDRTNPKDIDQFGKLVLKYADYIQGLPRQLSVHACGILISELPITSFGALELFPVGYPSTQFSMLEAEDVGLYKYDILSQRGLGHIKDAVELVKQRGEEIDIHRIQDFKEDERIKKLLKSGNTIGCFYVESPAMRQLLRKLEVEDYLGLVAASSIIRPGVASSGMMREYIIRFRDPVKRDEAKKANPILWKIMPDTFGVMVYQEDVIKVAHYYAGLTLEEADVMRRGMSGKFRSRAEFQAVKEKFFSNCKEREYVDAEAAEIWRQIESFAGYSFAKGHSASYAVESYQSLYLRAYHPVEFMVGVLNNFGGFYSTEFYLHEAKMLGAIIELPCVNNSTNLAVLKGNIIYMGFSLIKDLEEASIKNMLEERERNGVFESLSDFTKRVKISLEQLRILIRIRAFRFTGSSSKELLWEAHLIMSKTKVTVPRKELFELAPQPIALPELEYGEYEEALDEMKILGYPHTSPFSLIAKKYKGTVYANELMNHLGSVVYIIGYYVNTKSINTILGDRMMFGSFIDSHGNLFDTVHFPQSAARYPYTGKGCYLVKGTVIEDFGVPSIDVSHMQRLEWAFVKELVQ